MARLAPKESDKGPQGSWSIGKEIVGSDRMHRGWFIDQGRDNEFDAAAEQAGFAYAEMINKNNEQNGFWLFPTPVSLFVLVEYIPYTRIELLARNDIAFTGLRCFWPKDGRSTLGFMALVPQLLAVGYNVPLPFGASSTRTNDLLKVLLAHNTVLDAAEKAATANGTPRNFEFFDLALPFAQGKKDPRGSGDKITNVVPPICGHPAEVTVDYLRENFAPPIVRSTRREQWPEIVSWAAMRGERPMEEAA